jgi:hypothetical protein
VNASAIVSEATLAALEIVADLINLLNLLLHIANVLATAVITVGASTGGVVVALLVDLLTRLTLTRLAHTRLANTRLALLAIVLAIAVAVTVTVARLLLLLLEARAIIGLTVEEAATVSVLALAGLLPVEALAAGGGLNHLALAVDKLAIIS